MWLRVLGNPVKVQKFARDAEMLKRVCEARREISGCETLDGSRECPESTDGSQDRSFAERLLREMHITDSYQPSGCTCHCATLLHRVVGPPGVHTQNASRRAHAERLLCTSTRSEIWNFPTNGAATILGLFLGCAPAKV